MAIRLERTNKICPSYSWLLFSQCDGNARTPSDSEGVFAVLNSRFKVVASYEHLYGRLLGIGLASLSSGCSDLLWELVICLIRECS